MAKALVRRGTAVDIYTRWFDRSKSQIEPVPECPDLRVIRIPAGPRRFIPKEKMYDILPELAENMTSFIRENDLHYDLFHGHYVDAGIVTLAVATGFAKPAFFTAHSLGAWKREQMGGDPDEMETKYRFKHRVSEELRIFRSVEAQSVTTEVQKDKLEQLYGFVSDNVAVISPGVDVHSFRPPDPREKKTRTYVPDRYVFCLSRIDSNKGHDLLLDAFGLLRKEVSDIHLVIGGGSPEPEPREQEIVAGIRGIIDSKGLHEKVHVIGYVPDELLVPFYRQAKSFVLPSTFEPFGMTTLEAMACRRPVIASRFGGIRNVISSGQNGLLVDPTYANEFADAMIMLLKDRLLAERMGRAGHETILQHFSWEVIARKHITFYEKFMYPWAASLAAVMFKTSSSPNSLLLSNVCHVFIYLSKDHVV